MVDDASIHSSSTVQVEDDGASEKDNDASPPAAPVTVTASLSDHGQSTIRSYLLMSTGSLYRPKSSINKAISDKPKPTQRVKKTNYFV